MNHAGGAAKKLIVTSFTPLFIYYLLLETSRLHLLQTAVTRGAEKHKRHSFSAGLKEFLTED